MAELTPALLNSFLHLLLAILGFLSVTIRYVHGFLASGGMSERQAAAEVTTVPDIASSSRAVPESALHPGIAPGIFEHRTHSRSESTLNSVPEFSSQVHGGRDPPRRFYAVARGRVTGIYTNWDEVEPLVTRFPNARHRAFRTFEEAQDFIAREAARNGHQK